MATTTLLAYSLLPLRLRNVGIKPKGELIYVVDNTGNSAGALATWRNCARRRRIDSFAAGCCRSSTRHQPVDWKTSSLNLSVQTVSGLWPLAFEEAGEPESSKTQVQRPKTKVQRHHFDGV